MIGGTFRRSNDSRTATLDEFQDQTPFLDSSATVRCDWVISPCPPKQEKLKCSMCGKRPPKRDKVCERCSQKYRFRMY